MELYQELTMLVDALGAARIPYAICGGVAVVLHGHPRLTKDIDLLVRGEDLDSIREAIKPLGFTLDAGAIPFGVGTPQERVVHRISKIEGSNLLTLDLVVVTPTLDAAWQSRESYAWKKRTLTVVSREGLALMKRLAGRTQDKADLEHLGFDPEPPDA